jgi:uncharacterized phage infection (PIP) family protein YhgE
MKVIPMIVGFLIIIVLGFVGWFIYYKIRGAIKQVTQSFSELKGELEKVSQKSICSDNLSSQLKSDVAKIIAAKSEKISRLEGNILKMAEQLKENQDTTARLYQMMFAIQEQAKQFEEKLTRASNISAIAQQWEEFKSKFSPLINQIEPIEDIINQLRNFVDEGVLEQLEQLAPKLPLFYRETAITEEEEISQSLKYIELPEYMQESFIDFAEEYYIAAIEDYITAIEEKFSAEHDSIVDAINQLRSFVDTGVLTRLEQLAPKLQEAETIVQRPKNIDKTDKMTIEPNGAVHSNTTLLELGINIEEGEEKRIRRGRDDNPIFVIFSNPNQFPVNVTDIEIDLTDFETDLPLVIPPQEELSVEANFDASEVKEKKVKVSCYVSYEEHGVRQEKEIQIELETIGAYIPFDDEFDI